MEDKLFQEIKKKYENELAKDYEKVLIKRKSGVFGFLGFLCIFAIIFLVCSSHLNPIAMLILGFLAVIFFVLAFKNSAAGLNELTFLEKYLSTVVKDVVNSVFSKATFTLKDTYNCENIYEMSGFESDYDVFDHEITADFKYANRDIKLFKIETEVRTEDEDGNTEYETSFAGLFGVMEMNYILDGEIDINRYGDNPRAFPKVNMDSVDFNKVYRVYASDKVLAMQLLTHDVMDDILKLVNSIKSQFEFRIVENKIYFRIDDYNILFNNSKEAINKKELDEDYRAFVLLKNIIDLVEKAMKDNGLGE